MLVFSRRGSSHNTAHFPTFWLEGERNSSLFSMLHSYNSWVNRQPLSACRSTVTHHVGMPEMKIIGSSVGKEIFEPRCEKTGLWGFQPGPTQTGLYSHRRWLEA